MRIEEYLARIKSLIISSEVIGSYQIREEVIKEQEGYIRVKANLINDDILELMEYIVLEKNQAQIKKYSFHWQKEDGTLVKRWDNVVHHPEVANFPYHVHIGEDRIETSKEMNTETTLEIITQELGS
ncbi:hypothetical protein KKB84_05505 [bacterium]|nr:hypothetical protein [bacterium]MBU1153408.1 hypothetical protein [bacterium]MBU2599117.1 hypothetical protein [bacterium]